MGMNYYRVARLTQDIKTDIINKVSRAKSIKEIYDEVKRKSFKYGYTSIASEDGSVHVGKSSIGWKFHWDARVLLAIILEHPEIKDRKIPTDSSLYNKYDYFNDIDKIFNSLDISSDDMKKVTRDDIKSWLNKGIVYNEENEEISADELFEIVKAKEGGIDNRMYEKQHPNVYSLHSAHQVYVDGLFFSGDICEWC